MTIDLQLNQHMMSDLCCEIVCPSHVRPTNLPKFVVRLSAGTDEAEKTIYISSSRNDLHTSRVEIIILHFKVFHIRENDIAFDHSRENGGVADI